MARCASCSAELQPNWKFCIHCGTAVAPAAIRPAIITPAMDVATDEPRSQLTALGLFGWGLGILLAAIGVVAAVLLGTS
jgi:hypothetical protein